MRLSFVGASADIEILPDAKASTGRRIDTMRSVRLRRGEVVRIGALSGGAVLYIGVEGGFDIEPVLGSVSTYMRGAIGGWQGRALIAGDRLPLRLSIGERRRRLPIRSSRSFAARPVPRHRRTAERLFFGRRDRRCSSAATTRSAPAPNRMGMRLWARRSNIARPSISPPTASRPARSRCPATASRSCCWPIARPSAAIPKIATVISADLPALGRMPIGAKIRFAPVTAAEALRLRRLLIDEIARIPDRIEPIETASKPSSLPRSCRTATSSAASSTPATGSFRACSEAADFGQGEHQADDAAREDHAHSDRIDAAEEEEEEFVPAAAAQPVAEVVEPPTQSDDIPRGIACMVVATVMFAAVERVRQMAGGDLSGRRGDVHALVLLARGVRRLHAADHRIFGVRHAPAARPRRARPVAIDLADLRVMAFSMMPLAGAIAINFSAPLWSALVSILWLKERAGPVRWMVLLVGFLGVAAMLVSAASPIRRRSSCWTRRSPRLCSPFASDNVITVSVERSLSRVLPARPERRHAVSCHSSTHDDGVLSGWPAELCLRRCLRLAELAVARRRRGRWLRSRLLRQGVRLEPLRRPSAIFSISSQCRSAGSPRSGARPRQPDHGRHGLTVVQVLRALVLIA